MQPRIPKLLVGAKDVTDQVWIAELVQDRDVVKLDIQVLIDTLECASYRDVVLELNSDLVVDQSFEEAVQLVSPAHNCDTSRA